MRPVVMSATSGLPSFLQEQLLQAPENEVRLTGNLIGGAQADARGFLSVLILYWLLGQSLWNLTRFSNGKGPNIGKRASWSDRDQLIVQAGRARIRMHQRSPTCPARET